MTIFNSLGRVWCRDLFPAAGRYGQTSALFAAESLAGAPMPSFAQDPEELSGLETRRTGGVDTCSEVYRVAYGVPAGMRPENIEQRRRWKSA